MNIKNSALAALIAVFAVSAVFLGLGASGVLGKDLGDPPACNGGNCAINWQKYTTEQSD